MVGTSDLSHWEQRFVTDLHTRMKAGDAVKAHPVFSPRQLELIDDLCHKHFGDAV